MSRKPSLPAALLAIVALFGAAQAALAGAAGPELRPGMRMAPSQAEASTLLSGGPYKLVNTYVGYGAYASIPAGYNTVDLRSVSCGNAAGCHVGIDSMVQLQTTANWAICLSVDDVVVSCQYQGNLPDTGIYVIGNAKAISETVSQGSHTVRTEVYTEIASTLGRWQSDYKVYKP